VLLYHGPWNEAEQLARRVPGIDLIVVGQSGSDSHRRSFGTEGKTFLAQVTAGCTQVGKVTLHLGPERDVSDAEFERVLLADKLEEDGRVLRAFHEFQAGLVTSPVPMRSPLAVDEPFAGSFSCKECHLAEWNKWMGTAHSKAYDALDRRRHPADPECLECHTTGFGWKTGFGSLGQSADLWNVGCESCHRPRGKHVAKWGKKKEAGEPLPVPEWIPDGFALQCENCHQHNRDPLFKKNANKRHEKIKHKKIKH
jgi:hypothetical protein